MNYMMRILILTGALALAACASQGPATSAGASADRQGSSTTSSGSKGAPSGYYRKVIDGQEVFCQRDPDLGSRVQRSEKCLTRDQLDEEQRNSHNVMQDIQRSGVR
jgi:invasion protein IalB